MLFTVFLITDVSAFSPLLSGPSQTAAPFPWQKMMYNVLATRNIQQHEMKIEWVEIRRKNKQTKTSIYIYSIEKYVYYYYGIAQYREVLLLVLQFIFCSLNKCVMLLEYPQSSLFILLSS